MSATSSATMGTLLAGRRSGMQLKKTMIESSIHYILLLESVPEKLHEAIQHFILTLVNCSERCKLMGAVWQFVLHPQESFLSEEVRATVQCKKINWHDFVANACTM